MANISVLNYQWTGTAVVGPSTSVLHCQQGDENTAVTAANAFLNAIKSALPNDCVVSPPVAGPVLDELTGALVNTWSLGVSGPYTGTGGTLYAPGVGIRVTFPTIGVRNNRHVIGAWFIVPVVSAAFDGAGAIAAATLTQFRTAAVTLGTTANAVRIYSRPRASGGGVSYPTLTGVVPDKVSWLRTRRT